MHWRNVRVRGMLVSSAKIEPCFSASCSIFETFPRFSSKIWRRWFDLAPVSSYFILISTSLCHCWVSLDPSIQCIFSYSSMIFPNQKLAAEFAAACWSLRGGLCGNGASVADGGDDGAPRSDWVMLHPEKRVIFMFIFFWGLWLANSLVVVLI